MLSRRDALHLIAALSASSTVPFALSSEAAAARLEEPVTFDVGIFPPTLDAFGFPIPSPSAFADDRAHRLWDGLDWGMFGEGAPQEWAAVEKLMAQASDDAPHSEALRELSMAVVTLAVASWYAGARVGAELEAVRRAMLRAVRLCPHCWGSGRQETSDPAPCTTCSGAGTIATAAA